MASPTLLFLTFAAAAVLIVAYAPQYATAFYEYYQSFRNVAVPIVVIVIAWVLLATQSWSAILLAGFMVVVLVLGLYYEHGDAFPF